MHLRDQTPEVMCPDNEIEENPLPRDDTLLRVGRVVFLVSTVHQSGNVNFRLSAESKKHKKLVKEHFEALQSDGDSGTPSNSEGEDYRDDNSDDSDALEEEESPKLEKDQLATIARDRKQQGRHCMQEAFDGESTNSNL